MLEVWTSNNFQQYTFNSLIISSLIVTQEFYVQVFLLLMHLQKLNFLLGNIIFYSLLIIINDS